MTNLQILSNSIRTFENLYSLTDLHKASGGEAKHKPVLFLSNQQTKDLIAEIGQESKVGISTLAVKTVRGGKNPSTYACKEIVIAYAAWISPQFHLVVLRAFLNQLENSQKTEQTALPAPTTLTPEEQYMVQNAVKATHEKTGLSYGEIWARTKNKFKVAKYEQIERSQLNEVLTYITSPEPKPRGILLDEEAFYVVAKAIAKLNESTFEWEKMMDLFSELESHRNYKTAFNLGVASYNLAQSSEKIIMKNLVQMKNKVWKKEIEDFIFSNPHLQNHTENKLVHYLR